MKLIPFIKSLVKHIGVFKELVRELMSRFLRK